MNKIIPIQERPQIVEYSFINPQTSAFYEKQELTKEQYEEAQGSVLQIEKKDDGSYVASHVNVQLDNNDDVYRARIHNTITINPTDQIPEGVPLVIQIPGADFSKTDYKLTDIMNANTTSTQLRLFETSTAGRLGVPYFLLYKKVGSEEIYLGSDFKTLFYNTDIKIITKSFINFVKTNDPHYIGWGKFKIPLVQQLNPNDSFSYTDIQLDLISAIVTEILELNPVLKQHIINKFNQYQSFKEMIDKTSIFNLRTEQDLVIKFGEVKQRVRKTQADWYTKKNTLRNT